MTHGARAASAPPEGPLLTAILPVVAGLSVILLAFGTWLIPLLVGLGVWRHLGIEPPDRSRAAAGGVKVSVVTTLLFG